MRNFVTVILITLVTLLVFSCGEDEKETKLNSSDIVGNWHTENFEFIKNSCNLTDNFLKKFKKRKYFYINSIESNMELSICSDLTCDEKKIIDTYIFNESIKIKLSEKEINLSSFGNDDCILKVESEPILTFLDKINAKLIGIKYSFSNYGDCSRVFSQDGNKLINNSECILRAKSDLKKEK